MTRANVLYAERPVTKTPPLPHVNRFNHFRARDPISALTHFIGFLAAVAGMPVLLIRAAAVGADRMNLISLGIFMMSMVLLYGASTAYHTFMVSDASIKRLKRVDHMMIYVLIAGSYTPMCLIPLRNAGGVRLLTVVWGIALVGFAFTALWVTCPKWVSSVIYIAMGWVCITALGDIVSALSAPAFGLLLGGGIIYTLGGIIYAMKLPGLSKWIPGFGAHELFHCFVMGGTFCHYLLMLLYVAAM